MQNGWMVTVFVLLPNLLFVFFPPAEIPPERIGRNPAFERITGILERIGQAACFTIPVFYALRFDTALGKIAVTVGLCALLFYYAGWLRFVFSKRSFCLLFSPLAGIPIPMAIAPILVFLMAAINMQSWPLGIAAIVLAAGHLPISWNAWKRC
jgi:hypothetical protein